MSSPFDSTVYSSATIITIPKHMDNNNEGGTTTDNSEILKQENLKLKELALFKNKKKIISSKKCFYNSHIESN